MPSARGRAHTPVPPSGTLSLWYFCIVSLSCRLGQVPGFRVVADSTNVHSLLSSSPFPCSAGWSPNHFGLNLSHQSVGSRSVAFVGLAFVRWTDPRQVQGDELGVDLFGGLK